MAPYFFGKETLSELGNKQNYFQTSAFLPSQTTLLGMLRHHLLLRKGWAFPQVQPSTKFEISNLVGERGFVPNTKNDYGVIEKLSPVFITKNNNGHYFLCNKLYVKKKVKKEENDEEIEKLFEVKAKKSDGNSFGSTENTRSNFILQADDKNLTAKDFFKEHFLNFEKTTDKLEFESVISQVLQTGNTKTAYRKEMSDDEAYYRFNYASFNQHVDIRVKNKIKEEKRTYRKKSLTESNFMLNNSFQFAFYVKLKSEELEDNYNNVIIMGKEQSPFQLHIEKLPTGEIPVLFQNNSINSTDNRVWLLSGLFVATSNDLKMHSNFICADKTPFRCFTKAINHSLREKKWAYNLPIKTMEYSLYAQGGIVYADDIPKLENEFNSEWQTIGYNYFKTI